MNKINLHGKSDAEVSMIIDKYINDRAIDLVEKYNNGDTENVSDSTLRRILSHTNHIYLPIYTPTPSGAYVEDDEMDEYTRDLRLMSTDLSSSIFDVLLRKYTTSQLEDDIKSDEWTVVDSTAIVYSNLPEDIKVQFMYAWKHLHSYTTDFDTFVDELANNYSDKYRELVKYTKSNPDAIKLVFMKLVNEED